MDNKIKQLITPPRQMTAVYTLNNGFAHFNVDFMGLCEDGKLRPITLDGAGFIQVCDDLGIGYQGIHPNSDLAQFPKGKVGVGVNDQK